MRLKSPLAIILLLLLLCACAPKGPPVDAVSDLSSVIGQIRGVPEVAMSGFQDRLVGRFFSGEQRYPFDYRGKIAGDQPK